MFVCVCVGDYIGKGNNINKLIKGLNFIGEFWKNSDGVV